MEFNFDDKAADSFFGISEDKANPQISDAPAPVIEPPAGTLITTTHKVTLDQVGNLSRQTYTRGEYFFSGLVYIFGEVTAKEMVTKAKLAPKLPGAAQLLGLLATSPDLFSTDKFEPNLEPRAALTFANNVNNLTPDVFSDPSDYPYVLVTLKSLPVNLGTTPYYKEEDVDMNRGYLAYKVNTNAVVSKGVMKASTTKNLPKPFSSTESNKLKQGIASIPSSLKVEDYRKYFNALKPSLPVINFAQFKSYTQFIGNDPVVLGKQDMVLKAQSDQLCSANDLKDFRAYRSSVASYCKEYRSPLSRLSDAISTVTKWLIPINAIRGMFSTRLAIGHSESNRWQNLLAVSNFKLLTGDILDEHLKLDDFNTLDYKQMEFVQDILEKQDTSFNFNPNPTGEVKPKNNNSIIIKGKIHDHFLGVNIDEFFKTTTGPNGTVMISDVFHAPKQPDAKQGEIKTNNVIFLMNAQEVVYKKYALLLQERKCQAIIFKARPICTHDTQKNIYYGFTYKYLYSCFKGCSMIIFPGARLHNGELIIIVSPYKVILDLIKKNNDDLKLSIWPINLDVIASLNKGMQFRMYGSNMMRNALLSSGYSSLYGINEDYPNKKYEKVAAFLVHQPNTPKSSTSVGDYMNNLLGEMDDVDTGFGDFNDAEFSTSFSSAISPVPIPQLTTSLTKIQFQFSKNSTPVLATALKTFESKNFRQLKNPTKEEYEEGFFIYVVQYHDDDPNKFYAMYPLLYNEIKLQCPKEIDYNIRVEALVVDSYVINGYQQELQKRMEKFCFDNQNEEWFSNKKEVRHRATFINLFNIDFYNIEDFKEVLSPH